MAGTVWFFVQYLLIYHPILSLLNQTLCPLLQEYGAGRGKCGQSGSLAEPVSPHPTPHREEPTSNDFEGVRSRNPLPA